jgi:hypothetical protein
MNARGEAEEAEAAQREQRGGERGIDAEDPELRGSHTVLLTDEEATQLKCPLPS